MLEDDRAWTDYRSRFSAVYDEANYSPGLQGKVMRASHSLTERPYDLNMHFSRVLEIGAGTGEHLPFVRHSFDEYLLADHDKAALGIAKNKLSAIHSGKLHYEVLGDGQLSYPDRCFDQVIAAHVLEHIYKPHEAVREWARIIKDGGVLSILIPTDPGLAWRLGRHLGPRRRAISQGIAYDYVMAREHVNSCNNLVAILRHIFPGLREAWWPFGLPSMDINLFCALHATISWHASELRSVA